MGARTYWILPLGPTLNITGVFRQHQPAPCEQCNPSEPRRVGLVEAKSAGQCLGLTRMRGGPRVTLL